MLKVQDNPPMRTESFESVGQMNGTWYVAHTKSRCEKAFAFDLIGRGVAFYLPMVERTTISGGRKRRVLLPLFSSYLFFCGTPDDRHAALSTHRLCNVIPVTRREQFVNELTAIERALASNASLDLYPFAAVGERCRVRLGPFQGIEGTVVKREARALLVLQLSILGCGASLEIDSGLLEPAGA